MTMNKSGTTRKTRGAYLVCLVRLMHRNVTMRGILKWNIRSRMRLRSRAFLFLTLCPVAIVVLGMDAVVSRFSLSQPTIGCILKRLRK